MEGSFQSYKKQKLEISFLGKHLGKHLKLVKFQI